MRAGGIVLWALVATIVLILIGIFGSLIASGRITLFPAASPTATAAPEVTPVVDTSYALTVLNATGEDGLATAMKDQLVQAGWSADNVLASQASSSDFAETTVYYSFASDEAAALGVADLIGGANVELNETYQPVDDADTADVDESQARQLTIVIGLDRTAAGAPAETPAAQ